MGLGNRKTNASAFDPIVKIDCRDGKITRCDRVQENGEWVTKPVPIEPDKFEAVFDMPNMKIGWLCFNPPDFQLVPVGDDIGEQPTDKHKEGFKVRLLLRNGSGEGVSGVGVDEDTQMHVRHDAKYEATPGRVPGVGLIPTRRDLRFEIGDLKRRSWRSWRLGG